jgi:hypothetical protein
VLAGRYVNDAEVTAVLTDSEGNIIAPAGQGGSFPLAHQANSDGDYAGRIPFDTPLLEGSQYTLTVTAVGAGLQLVVKMTRRAAFKGP